MTDPLLRYKIGLSLINGIGTLNAKKLIAHIGSVEGVFSEKKSKLLKIDGVGLILANNIVNNDVLSQADKEINFIEKNNINVHFYLDKSYPFRLKQCADAPLLYYSKGSRNHDTRKIISIVGTRNATDYGKTNCIRLIENLSNNGHEVVIVSGLAYGIDITAHKAALDNNLQTFAVLGHGLDKIYPWAHKKVAQDIIDNGALISEFISDSKPDRQNFVKRNRIIAGISDVTIVIESGAKGGSLITADIANSYDRDVYTFPGRIGDEYSSGCNYLIKTNRASLIEGIDDLEYLLGWDADKKKKKSSIQQKLFIDLNNQEQDIISLIREYGEVQIDMISMKTKILQGTLSAILLKLEFEGFIKTLPGKVYTLT